MDRNRLKRKVQDAQLALVSGNYESADMVDYVGSLQLFDGVWIDMEHSPVTWGDLSGMSRAADLWGMSSVVRVRANDPTIISLTLGEGIDGVIVPHVNTRQEAEQAVQAAKFEPVGRRGTSGGRKAYGVSDWYARANGETFVVVMIEDIVAVENLSEILKVGDIDVYYVSHHDLAQSMGLLTQPNHPKITETFDGAIKQIADAGKIAGATVSEREMEKYLPMGVRWLKVPQWRSWIAAGASAFVKKVEAQPKS